MNILLLLFRSYVREEIPARSEDTQRKLRLRRKKYNFPVGFPNCDAVQLVFIRSCCIYFFFNFQQCNYDVSSATRIK